MVLFLLKSLLIILQTISLSIWNFPTSIRIINQQSVTKAEQTAAIFSGVWLAQGLTAAGLSSTLSHTLQNHPYHSNTFVHDEHESLFAFFNFLKVFVAVKPLLKQNLIKRQNTINPWCGCHTDIVGLFGRLFPTFYHLPFIDSTTCTAFMQSVLKLNSLAVYELYFWLKNLNIQNVV